MYTYSLKNLKAVEVSVFVTPLDPTFQTEVQNAVEAKLSGRGMKILPLSNGSMRPILSICVEPIPIGLVRSFNSAFRSRRMAGIPIGTRTGSLTVREPVLAYAPDPSSPTVTTEPCSFNGKKLIYPTDDRDKILREIKDLVEPFLSDWIKANPK
jgi:hypothetical protein